MVEEDTLVALGLYKGMEIEDPFIDKIRRHNQKTQGINHALRYLQSLRTEQQVRNYLYKKKIDSIIVEEVIDYLVEKHYIDDYDYGLRYLSDAQKLKGYGRKKIGHMLRQKGLKSSLIDHILLELDEELEFHNCMKLGKKHLKDSKNSKEIHKTFRFLMGRGYDYEMIERVMEKICGKE